jgi:hypothetical protein
MTDQAVADAVQHAWQRALRVSGHRGAGVRLVVGELPALRGDHPDLADALHALLVEAVARRGEACTELRFDLASRHEGGVSLRVHAGEGSFSTVLD